MNAQMFESHRLADENRVFSPALLVYPALIRRNLQRMIDQAGSADRLRPHVKTHKMREVVDMMSALGVTKVKCATIAEAELCAQAGVPDVLLAYQPVGPQIDRLLQLTRAHPSTRVATIVDCQEIVSALDHAARSAGVRIPVYLDIDGGMRRSGIAPGPEALALYRSLANAPSLTAAGLHVYDGHIRDSDPAKRRAHCDRDLQPVRAFQHSLTESGLPLPSIIMGGTPTFPIHARHPDVECSPGTCVLWDAGYAGLLPDMDYAFAALVFTRVVSKPAPHRLCLDLGHKAVASEGPHPRVVFPALPSAQTVSHSEEHLVLETDRAGDFQVGDGLYGIPWHICPTVALYGEAVVVEDGRAAGFWKVAARERRLTI